jgi:hypothetical protein
MNNKESGYKVLYERMSILWQADRSFLFQEEREEGFCSAKLENPLRSTFTTLLVEYYYETAPKTAIGGTEWLVGI